MKPTRFLSSSPHMTAQLDRQCDRSHAHQHLTGGRCADAAFYPLPLIQAMIKWTKATADVEDAAQEGKKSKAYMQASGMEPLSDKAQEMPTSEPAETPHCSVKRYKAETQVRVDFEPGQLKDKNADEYTGDLLEHSLYQGGLH